MKFHVYAINWNEERLLPFFFKHYWQADKIYIMDNESTDSSHEIIKSYPNAEIISFKSHNSLDDQTNSRMKSQAWKQSVGIADWVIVQDLDEFLFFPKYPTDICSGLTELDATGYTMAKSKGWNMYCSDEEFSLIQQKDLNLASSIWNSSFEPYNGCYDKVLAFKLGEIKDINYAVGAHSWYPNGRVSIDNISTKLLHFKYIGPTYLKERYKIIRNRMSGTNRSNQWGNQYNRSDADIDLMIDHFFDKYGRMNNVKFMYMDPTIAPIKFHGMRCLLKTYGHHDIISHNILNGAIWEPRVAETIFSLCSRPDTIFLDIGSNIGAHTAIARLAGAKKIWAFECNPNTAALLEQTLYLNLWNDRVHLINKGLSNVSGHLPFTIVSDNLGASYIPINRKEWNGPRSATNGVDVVTFDSLDLDLSGCSNIVAKLDVEGHELQVLQGAKTMLADERLKEIIMELNPACTNVDILTSILDLLESFSFTTYYLLFRVPGDEWAGKEIGTLPQMPQVERDLIIKWFNEGNIMEILFTKKGVPTLFQS